MIRTMYGIHLPTRVIFFHWNQQQEYFGSTAYFMSMLPFQKASIPVLPWVAGTWITFNDYNA